MTNPSNAAIALTSTVMGLIPLRPGVLQHELVVPATAEGYEVVARCRDIEAAAGCLDNALDNGLVVDQLGHPTTIPVLTGEVSRRLTALRETMARNGVLDSLDSAGKAAAAAAMSAVAAEL